MRKALRVLPAEINLMVYRRPRVVPIVDDARTFYSEGHAYVKPDEVPSRQAYEYKYADRHDETTKWLSLNRKF